MQLNPSETINIRWSFEDVLSIREDLTDEQAMFVLEAVDDNHDASIGVNWNVIECMADDMYPEGDV